MQMIKTIEAEYFKMLDDYKVKKFNAIHCGLDT